MTEEFLKNQSFDFVKEETGYITKSDDEDVYKFEGIASSYGNTDVYGDVFEEGSLDSSLNKTVPILINHSWNVKDIVGKGILENGADNTVNILGNFTKGIEQSENLVKLKSDKVPLKLSIGGRIKKSEIVNRDGEWIRVIKEADIVEVSVVFRGANPVAEITKSENKDNLDELINKCEQFINVINKKYGGN